THLVADASEMDRERGTPAASAKNGHIPHQSSLAATRIPTRRSVPARTRRRLERWRKMMRPATAIAAATTGAGLPDAYAIGGNATEARTEPTEMYRVIQTAAKKIARAGGTATGVK